jgi:tetratricopeptide (TPR) repeat protein
MTSLGASIAYSYAHLAESTRRLLPAVSLFQAVADETILAAFSMAHDVPKRFTGATRQDCRIALNDAAEVGLLSPLGAGMYRIHPALAAYLTARWREENLADYDTMREAAIRALVTGCASVSMLLERQIESGGAALAYTVIGRQCRTLGSTLGYALAHRLWEDAQLIARVLNHYWDTRGLAEEADAWADEVRLATEGTDGMPPALDSPAGGLWLFIVDAQARRHARYFRLDEAEHTHHQLRTWLEAGAPSASSQGSLAATYHSLGIVAQQRGQLDDAKNWYQKSLTVNEELGGTRSMAHTYHQLGTVAQLGRQLDDAGSWYRKALSIYKELGDRARMSGTYAQLGMVALDQDQVDDAEDWYRKALIIIEELGDRRGMAAVYHQLGIAASKRSRLDAAQNWYHKALTIHEELGDKPRIAGTYTALGMLAMQRTQPDEAEDWYHKALAIQERLGNKPGMAHLFGQLGGVAAARGQASQVLEWMVRGVALFDAFPHPSTIPLPRLLAGFTRQAGIGALEDCWRKVTGEPLPQAVREYVEAHGR